MNANNRKPQPASPFTTHLGIDFIAVDDGISKCRMEVRDFHRNRGGLVHGGATYSMVDTSMGAAVHSLLDKHEWCATIEIKISYYAPVKGGEITCDSRVLKRGKRMAFIESTITHEDRIIGQATGTFAITTSADAG